MKRFLQQLLLWLILLVSIGGVLWLSYSDQDKVLNYILCAVSFLFSLAFVPALHELGHVCMGALGKMHFMSITFFCISISKAGLKFVNPFGETAGETRMYLTDGDPAQNKRKFLWFSLGGVLFNLAYLVICLPILVIVNKPILWSALGMTLPYTIYQILLNIMPWSDDSGAFDGAIFWGLCNNDPSILTLMNIFIFQGELMEDKTPAQIRRELLFDLEQLPEDDPQFAHLQLWRYYYHLDGGDHKEAARMLTRLEGCAEYIPASYLPPIYCELLYIYSKLTPDEELADRYFALLDTAEASQALACSVQAARAINAYKIYKGMPADREVDLSQENYLGLREMEKRLRIL